MPTSPFKGKAKSKARGNMNTSSGKPMGLKSLVAKASTKGSSGRAQGQKQMPIGRVGGKRLKKTFSTAQMGGKKTLGAIRKSVKTTMGHY